MKITGTTYILLPFIFGTLLSLWLCYTLTNIVYLTRADDLTLQRIVPYSDEWGDCLNIPLEKLLWRVPLQHMRNRWINKPDAHRIASSVGLNVMVHRQMIIICAARSVAMRDTTSRYRLSVRFKRWPVFNTFQLFLPDALIQTIPPYDDPSGFSFEAFYQVPGLPACTSPSLSDLWTIK
ncbi:hypothetical protein BJ138DRAFT_344049 [Hygrophoropsis aurantiaca]|uniref:Uncharacterized protein n=1 Tax=Hygrophoropsis aurantiaca TaxID=72124 RepID=A0ACB8A5L6_9AGAM|nr:hypothetical protein BJ138DRAFT_344049 [Hygrophoropsis aurantiaca]